MTSALVRQGLVRRRRRVRVLGLTGSIGMGKSTLANMARRLGCRVHDADKTVHDLLGPGGAAVASVVESFPTALGIDGCVDRRVLGGLVFENPIKIRVLENILHPLVHDRERTFLKRAGRDRCRVVVLDIPLLFETSGEARCDLVASVTAPLFLRRQRILKRGGLSLERLAQIVNRQTSEVFKALNSDFVVQTGLGRRFALVALRRALKQAISGPYRVFGRRRYRPYA